MLVLSRKCKDDCVDKALSKIRIGGNVIITVVDVGRRQVKLMIDAPNDVDIWREEVYVKIQEGIEARVGRGDDG